VPEVFTRGPTPVDGGPRGDLVDFVRPHQDANVNDLFGNRTPAVLSFVRYDLAAAQYIRQSGTYEQRTLDEMQAQFDRKRIPIEERSIQPLPNSAASLKVVFWLVDRTNSPTHPDGMTVFPYWDPNYPPPPGGKTPGSDTWRKCVIVDPGGKHVGETRTVDCNGTKAKPNPVRAKVIGLNRFYAVKLSTKDDVVDAQAVLKSSPADRKPPGDRHADIGDYLVLVAMHVTTKEMANWTWQTFWWSLTPNVSNGRGRPQSVKGVWRNYEMCTAYSMVTPRSAKGRPSACFNPYLETDLGPTKFFKVDNQWFPPDPMAGTRSNCMSCHVRAAFGEVGPRTANYGRIFNEGYLAPNDPYFDGLTKTDFLWSIPGNALPPLKKKR
jgi:hypothetical protein